MSARIQLEASQGAALHESVEIFDNRIDWVKKNYKAEHSLGCMEGIAKLSVFRYMGSSHRKMDCTRRITETRFHGELAV
jgi:hypothetical protein